ncbi:alanine racemase [Candidatus Gracilibacteria bacterium]|nr:alanine racemase [Candidatus Gracilibacteria bacterium]MCF7819242.1 alanine racemase [Candidatus Gracilibacteria bacterium]
MLSTSYIELSKKALKSNLQFVKNRLQPGVKLCSIIKGNAYGHGIELFVPLAEKCGVRRFGVFSADEAFRTSKVQQKKSHIMIMGMIDEAALEWAIENDIEFFVFDLGRLEKSIQIARQMDKKARIHVELETGMNRTGFEKKLIPQVVETIQENASFLKLMGICTHLAGAESIANYYRVKKQRELFHKIKRPFQNLSIKPHFYHMASSAATMRYPKAQLDMVRVGILQYGFFPSQEIRIESFQKIKKDPNPLQRILSWKSSVMSLKTVKKGSFIGYGNAFLASEDMRIASVPVGYFHGFSRSLSNKGRVLIHGHPANVVGTVNMNMMLVDVSHLVGVKPGDEVVLIGNQDESELSVTSFAGQTGEQMNYELLTRLPENIPRQITA